MTEEDRDLFDALVATASAKFGGELTIILRLSASEGAGREASWKIDFGIPVEGNAYPVWAQIDCMPEGPDFGTAAKAALAMAENHPDHDEDEEDC